MEENEIRMYKWIERIPPVHWLYMRIAEPRVVRLLYFGIYLMMLLPGLLLILSPPHNIKDVVGLTSLYVLATFLLIGGLFGAVSVLPGVWWLERVGIILICTAIAMYVVTVIALHASPIGIAVSIAFILAFMVRFITIRHHQLAPKVVTLTREE